MEQSELVQTAFFGGEQLTFSNPFPLEDNTPSNGENKDQRLEAYAYLGRLAYAGEADGAARQAHSLNADPNLLRRAGSRQSIRDMSKAMQRTVKADAKLQNKSIEVIAGQLPVGQGDPNEYLPDYQMTRKQCQEWHVASVAAALEEVFGTGNQEAAANRYRARRWLGIETMPTKTRDNPPPDPYFISRLLAAAQRRD